METYQFLNERFKADEVLSIRQRDDAPMGFAGWYFRIFPCYQFDIKFVECRISNSSRWVGCPNPPDAYLVYNAGKITRFGEDDYGRAMDFCAFLIKKREACINT